MKINISLLITKRKKRNNTSNLRYYPYLQYFNKNIENETLYLFIIQFTIIFSVNAQKYM